MLFKEKFGHEFASILLRNGHEFRHDRATITPRSGHDRCPGQSSIAVRSTREDFATQAPRLRLDRAAIAARSSRDRGVLPRILRAD